MISVIVPVYNVEKYLSTCLDSILNQTFQNFELILVDDGSTDSCGCICDKYEKLDNRIKVIHKKNGGLSEARNVGIEASVGEYITFIDSDDYVNQFFLEYLFREIIKYQADISACGYYRVKDDEAIFPIRGDNNTIFMTNKEAVKAAYLSKLPGFEFITCAKLYRSSLFKKYQITFPKGKIHEDMFTTYKLLYYAQAIVFFNQDMYYYRFRPGSIMTSNYSLKNISVLEAAHEACVFFETKGEKELLSISFNAYLKHLLNVYQHLTYENVKENKKEIFKVLKLKITKDWKYYSTKITMPLKKRVFYKILVFYPDIMMKILKIFRIKI